MSAHTTIPSPIRASRRRLLAAAAGAIALGAASTLFAIGVGHDREAGTPVPDASAQRYAERIAALTPEQLAAAFGAGVYNTGPIWPTELTAEERRYVKDMATLTPERLAAAFGTEGATTLALGAHERRYVEGITALSPAELAAAFGARRAP